MTESGRKQRNQARTKELYPTFAVRVRNVVDRLEASGLRPRIQDAWRSEADQLKAFSAGNSAVEYGFHNVTAADGTKEALAVDMLDDDAPLKPSSRYLLRLAGAAEEEGLRTLIRWGLSAQEIKAVNTAIRNEVWSAKVRIGKDPTHVQPVGISITEARGGKRPG